MKLKQIRHGYGHDRTGRTTDIIDGSFAYHVRRYRHAAGLSQRKMAMLAHLSHTAIEDIECTRRLAGSVEVLFRIAAVLGCPADELVAPEQKRGFRAEVDRRADALGLTSARPTVAAEAFPTYHLAVAYRSPHLVLALSDGSSILEVRSWRVPHTEPERMRALIEGEAKAYGAKDVVVEAGSRTSDCFFSLGIPHRALTLRHAKQFVLRTDDGRPPSNKPFFRLLVERHPELRRYVKVLPLTGDVAMSEDWRVARLVVATLALAAPAAMAPVPRTVKGDPCAPPVERRRRSA